MGRLYFEALQPQRLDIAPSTFISAVLTVIAEPLLGDILYTVVDPRIKYT